MSDAVEFIHANRSIFDDAFKKYATGPHKITDKKYSVMDYGKILNDTCDFIEGYIDYKLDGNEHYAGRILTTTKNMFDTMLVDKTYRREIYIDEYKSCVEEFSEQARRLQELLRECDDLKNPDSESVRLSNACDKHFKRISKVVVDDLKLYMWIVSKNKFVEYTISEYLRYEFLDPSSPVMHEKQTNS